MNNSITDLPIYVELNLFSAHGVSDSVYAKIQDLQELRDYFYYDNKAKKVKPYQESQYGSYVVRAIFVVDNEKNRHVYYMDAGIKHHLSVTLKETLRSAPIESRIA